MGAIGLGGRWSGDLGWLLGESDVQFVAVCDVRQGSRDGAKNSVNSQYGNKDCAAYRDFRDLLAERPEMDAMLIATGDCWHTPASIAAMQAGKDVYCEKPGALTIAQGQALVTATKRYGRVFQTGAQRASEANFIVAGELVRHGYLGKIHTVYAHLGYLPDWPRVNAALPAEPEPPKEELDWDLGLGPSPWRPYNGAFLGQYPSPGWYTQYDFAGGIPQWGSHTILQCQLDLGLADTSPVQYEYPADLKGPGMTVHFANVGQVGRQVRRLARFLWRQIRRGRWLGGNRRRVPGAGGFLAAAAARLQEIGAELHHANPAPAESHA